MLVVESREGLPEMAIPHTRVGLSPGSLPRLYTWDAHSRHAGTFPSSSTHLPLTIYHDDITRDLTAEDEERIMFSLQRRDRVRRIYLTKPVPCLQKLIAAMDDQFPMLEYLR